MTRGSTSSRVGLVVVAALGLLPVLVGMVVAWGAVFGLIRT